MFKRLSRRFVLLLLLIEFLDEFVYGMREAAWPLIQDDLGLTYGEIGLILSLPGLLALFIDPFVGILAQMGYRKRLMIGGGIAFGLSAFGVALSESFLMLLIVEIISFPASGGLVDTAQIALMDHQPQRHEQNMARWTFFGSLGVTVSPILLALGLGVGLGWREWFVFGGFLTMLLLIPLLRMKLPHPDDAETPENIFAGLKMAYAILKERTILRWLVLLQFSDLMLDVLLAWLALYMVNVAGMTPAQGALAVTVWSIAGLVGDFLLIPLLERVRGLTYLRISTIIELLLYPAFLLIEPYGIKLAVLGLIGFFNAGWYSILTGQVYTAMQGRTGLALTVSSVTGIIGTTLPLIVGLVANQFGLAMAMWLMWLGPIALLIGLPRRNHSVSTSSNGIT